MAVLCFTGVVDYLPHRHVQDHFSRVFCGRLIKARVGSGGDGVLSGAVKLVGKLGGVNSL